MNRILRPTLSMRALQFITVCALTLFSFSTVKAVPCPELVTVAADASCQGNYIFDYATLDNVDLTANNWVYTLGGASENNTQFVFGGTAFPPTSINVNLFYGISTVNFNDLGGTTCVTTVVVTEDADDIPADLCADITVSLDAATGCMAEVILEDAEINDATCMDASGTTIEISWDGAGEDTRIFTTADINSPIPVGHTVYVSKAGNVGSCTKMILVEDVTVPDLSCPASATVEVAPGCGYLYNYEVDMTLPCGGSMAVLQTGGGPSGTLLAAGIYSYEYAIYDDVGTTLEDCTWILEVLESELAGTQLNCIGQLNVSIDQDCSATIDATTILAGNLCFPEAELLVSAETASGILGPAATITFDDSYVGQDVTVSVSDPNGINSCWGIVTIEDKVAPIVICPADQTISCTDDTSPDVLGEATVSGTCDVTINHRDNVEVFNCVGDYQSVISRVWYAIDASGNMSIPCLQTIYVERETLADASYPLHWDGLDVHVGISDNGVGANDPLACDEEGVVWNPLTREDGRVVPSPYNTYKTNGDIDLIGTGAPGDVGTCGTIYSFYEDLIIDICNDNCESYNPSYKVLRTWDVFDWCSGLTNVHEQIIKVLDTIAPEFTELPDVTISTDLWGCGATYTLPAGSATDNCSTDIHVSMQALIDLDDPESAVGTVIDGVLTLPSGTDLAYVFVSYSDCCGNTSVDTFTIDIIDQVPPVVVADQHTVVTLNNQMDDGSTKVFAETFDDGSFDGCGPIDWWVRRMDNACENYDGLNADGTASTTEIDEVNDFHKYVHFCCDDTDEDQMVVFMVCDDADGNGIPEMDTDDNCSFAMISVDVQDKLAPTIVCPPTVTINCIDFVAYIDYLDVALDSDGETVLNTAFGSAYSNSTCGELGVQTFTGGDVCGEGTATRAFEVTSDTGTADCTQTIQIRPEIENVLACSDITFPAGSAEDDLFRKFLKDTPFEPNFIWCATNNPNISTEPLDDVLENLPAIIVEGCSDATITAPIINIDDLCSEVGINLTLDTFNFAGGACMKILAHWEVIDQCLFQENFEINEEVNPFVTENGYYELYVEYDIFDTIEPDLDCDDVEVNTSDCIKNFDTFTASATDECTPADLISYTYKVDLDNDGDFDYPADGTYAEGNSFDANLVDGLDIGEHSITWVAYDGCGNYSTCIQEIEVKKEVKAPTPYCHLGISSAVMDEQFGCSVETWAVDFVAGGEAACNAELTHLMIPYQDIYGDPADLEDDLSVEEALAMASDRWTFGCDYIENGEAHVIEIRIYAIDEYGNSDYCDASLTLNDNFDCCDDLLGTFSAIGGNVATAEGVEVESIDVKIMTESPEFPKIQQTSKEGSYMFTSLPYDINYEVSASNNENTKEGVSTLDLVLIQRHILGITTLDSPYKLIAADINNTETITASDLLQLRKLILGLYPNDELPSNNSWRFVDNSSTFADESHPFPFDEMINVNELSQAMYNQNFIGVKIGDVNATVSQARAGNTVPRSNETFSIVTDDISFTAEEKVSVSFSVEELKNIYGFQFEMNYNENALQFVNIESNSIALEASNVAIDNGVIKASWNNMELTEIQKDDQVFTIEFKATTTGKLSEVLKVSNKNLVSEAYNANLEPEDFKVNFRSIEDAEFSLLQNEPNPFKNNTAISFVLPESGNASLKVYDVTGRVILTKSANYAKGLNTIVIEGKEMSASGVLYYQLSYGNSSATRKMIRLD